MGSDQSKWDKSQPCNF